MFVSAITKVRHLSLSQSLHPISLTNILILSYHLRLTLVICLFPSAFPTKGLHAFLFSPVCAKCHISAFPLLFELAISDVRILKEKFIDVVRFHLS